MVEVRLWLDGGWMGGVWTLGSQLGFVMRSKGPDGQPHLLTPLIYGESVLVCCCFCAAPPYPPELDHVREVYFYRFTLESIRIGTEVEFLLF